MEVKKYDVVQFLEKHKWCGCLGIVDSITPSQMMVGVPVPMQGIAYIFAKMDEVEVIGHAVMIPKE